MKNRRRINQSNKPSFFFRISVLIVIVLLITQILVSNQLATAGTELSKLEKRIVEVEVTNQELRQQITKKTSLEYLTEEATKRGLDQLPRLRQIKVDGS